VFVSHSSRDSIVRPERAVLSGQRGLANAIHKRTGLGLAEPMLGEIKNACHPQPAAQRAPILVLPVEVEEPGLPHEGQRGNGRHHLRDARNRADHPVPLSGRYQRERLSA
jgi:hypothetical protein